MQPPPFFSNHENNGLLVKLKPIPHLNANPDRLIAKMITFAGIVTDQSDGNKRHYSPRGIVCTVRLFIIPQIWKEEDRNDRGICTKLHIKKQPEGPG